MFGSNFKFRLSEVWEFQNSNFDCQKSGMLTAKELTGAPLIRFSTLPFSIYPLDDDHLDADKK